MMEPISVPMKRTEVLVNDFVRSVYNWMFVGLALTGFTDYFVSTNQAILHLIYSNRLVFFGLIIVELGLVFSIAGMVNRMSARTATALFVIYSVVPMPWYLSSMFSKTPMWLIVFRTKRRDLRPGPSLQKAFKKRPHKAVPTLTRRKNSPIIQL